MIKIGNSPVADIHIGSTPVRAVYAGSQKIWPTDVSYTYTIENARLTYSSGTKLNAGGTNYAQVLATVKKWQGSTLVETLTNQVLQPVVGSSNFYASGNRIYGRDRGTTAGNERSGTVYGRYNDVQSTGLTVYQEANGYTSSYTYRKTFSMDNLGNIPGSGATYNFMANSYRTETRTYTSGSEQELAEVAYASTLSGVPSTVQFSQTTISGYVSGTVTIPENGPSERDITIKMYAGDGYTDFTFRQDAADTYAFLLDSASSDTQQFEYAAGSVDLGIISSKNGSYFGDISVSTLPSWCHVSHVRDGSTNKIKLTISVDSNIGTNERSTSIVLTQNGGDSKTITISVTQLAEHAHYMRLVPSTSPQYIQPLQSIVFSVETDSPYWVATYRIPLGWNITEDHTDNTIEVYLEEGAMAASFSFQVTGDDTPTVQMQVLASN